MQQLQMNLKKSFVTGIKTVESEDEEADHKEEPEKEEISNVKNLLGKKLSKMVSAVDENDESVDPQSLLDPGFVDIARITGGMSFGALCLLDSKPRMATNKCLTKCHLMTLSKSDYDKTLNTIQHKRRMNLVNVVKKIALFSNMTNSQLTRFSFFLKPMSVNRDYYLYKEGNPVEGVYIIKSGEFLVSRKLILPNKSTKQFQDNIFSDPKRA